MRVEPKNPPHFINRKLTVEEQTLKKIAELRENSSMVIDCNDLV